MIGVRRVISYLILCVLGRLIMLIHIVWVLTGLVFIGKLSVSLAFPEHPDLIFPAANCSGERSGSYTRVALQ